VKPSITRRVLVVDNSPLVLEYMTQILGEVGCNVTCAENGLAALLVLDEANPDIVFTDLMMPYIDGFRLIRVLRSRERWAELFIVALSAIAREKEIDLASMQIDLCIAKGPLREMSKHVFAALEHAKSGRVHGNDQTLLGLDEVHERYITRELLSELDRFRILTDSLSDGVLTTSGDGLVVSANRAAVKILGVQEESLLGRHVDSIGLEPYVGDDAELQQSLPEARGGTLYQIRSAIALMTELPVVDKLQDLRLLLIRDVTEIVNSRRALHEALEDRELLLREVHHRVKNNLATISSLISIQAGPLPAGDTRSVLEHLRGQVESIGLVHDRIYRGDTLSTIEFQEYARDLLANLIRLHGASSSVKFHVSGDSLQMVAGTAIPLGLILAELIINSLKHGFPDGRTGTIDLKLTSKGEQRWSLDFQDDGVGWNVGSTMASGTLGIRVLKGLSAQLGGSIVFPESPDRIVHLEFSSRTT